jgi:hypothetical protein
MSKESIPQLPRRRFHADAFLRGALSHIIAVDVKLQTIFASQIRDEFLIDIRLRSPQLVVEMNNGKDDAEFVLQLQQQPQKRDGINAAGNGHAHTIPGTQHFLPPNVRKQALSQRMHGIMVQE